MAAQSQRATSGGFLPVLPPRFALFELALFAIIIAIEWTWEPFPDLTKLNPHPYWIAVLLLSLQYGTVSGLLAAALAIGGSVLIGLSEPEIGESYFSYLIRVWTQPVLWIVVGMLLGSFRMRQIEEREYLQRQVDETSVRAAALTGYSDRLKLRVDALERQLASGAKPETTRLLDALGQLSAGVGSKHLETVFETAFPKAQASVFALEPTGLRLLHAHHWPADSRWRRDIALTEPLAQAVATQGRSLSLLNAEDERVLAGEGLFAVPLMSADGSAVVGMLKIEQMPPSAIDASTLVRLSVLARHLGTAAAVAPPQAANPETTTSLRAFAVPLLRRRPAGATTHTSSHGGTARTATLSAMTKLPDTAS